MYVCNTHFMHCIAVNSREENYIFIIIAYTVLCASRYARQTFEEEEKNQCHRDRDKKWFVYCSQTSATSNMNVSTISAAQTIDT